jgi:uncharacterized membrane protein YraQ (UPF0718 family)
MQWLSDFFLKMTWLEQLVANLLIILGMQPSSMWHGVLTFFIYDVIKIFILLTLLIYMVSFIQSYFSPERTRDILRPLKGIKGNIISALLGTLTPFCSCSSIPIFIGFTKAGLPIGMTFSFLISSPLVDLASVILLASVFGWGVAGLYVLVGLVMAVLGGTLIETFKLERYLASFLRKPPSQQHVQITPQETLTLRSRHTYALEQVKDIFKRVYVYVLLGVGIGAFIHGVIPQLWIDTLLGSDKWYSLPLATLMGVPMYADIFGTLPIAESLLFRGVHVGTILSFMMAVTALSLPSLILLKKVVTYKLLGFFVVYITTSIMGIGLLFNLIFT